MCFFCSVRQVHYKAVWVGDFCTGRVALGAKLVAYSVLNGLKCRHSCMRSREMSGLVSTVADGVAVNVDSTVSFLQTAAAPMGP